MKDTANFCMRNLDSTGTCLARKSCAAKLLEGWSHAVIKFRSAVNMIIVTEDVKGSNIMA